MPNLRLAPNLNLPPEAVTQTFGILAVRGAGKTNAAAVMAEGMLGAKLPVCVVDPVGVWWGLRSSKDGKGPGFCISIFGGAHGDVPLERSAGQLLADLVADERLSSILDLSDFSEGDKTKFLIDFAERLYRRNRDPIHLFLEEADDYAPQRPFREQARLLRAWENVVRRGRTRGLGITMITQRSAALNKNVLTQIETLIVLRTTSPQDRKAILAWVDYHGQSRELVESLPGLETGEAWVWSPSWLRQLRRIRLPLRSTYDSAATPKNLKSRRPAATLADIDLGAIRDRMAETIERARESDPKELRARVRALETELAKAQAEKPAPRAAKEKIIKKEVPILDSLDRAFLKKAHTSFSKRIEALESGCQILLNMLGAFRENWAHLENKVDESIKRALDIDGRQKVFPPRKTISIYEPAKIIPFSGSAPARPREPKSANEGSLKLRAGERRILAVLAQGHPLRRSRAQVGTLAGLTPSGGTFNTYFGVLRRHGLVEEAADGLVGITEGGLAEVGSDVPSAPRTPADVADMWKSRLRRGERALLDALLEAHPRGLTRKALADATRLEMTGGTFNTYLNVLRRNGLAEVNGSEVRAGEALFSF